MKKHIYLILIVFFTFMGEGLPSVLNASEVSTGVAMMYDWWKPGFMKMENETAAKRFGLIHGKELVDHSCWDPRSRRKLTATGTWVPHFL
jgi:hypothetical protein